MTRVMHRVHHPCHAKMPKLHTRLNTSAMAVIEVEEGLASDHD